MPLRIPRRNKLTSTLTTIAVAAFGLALIAYAAWSVRDGADRRLDCVASTHRCTLTQDFILRSDDGESFDARDMGAPSAGRLGKSGFTVVVVPDRADPGRTVSIGDLTFAAADDEREQLDAARRGVPSGDVHLASDSRGGRAVGGLVVATIGLAAVAGAIREVRIRRRRRRAAGDNTTPSSFPGPDAPAPSLVEVMSGIEQQREDLHQQQLAPIVDLLRPWLPEPVLAAGSFKPSGATRRGLRWPAWVMVAATPTTVTAFGVAFETTGLFPARPTYRVLGVLGQWPTDAVECAEDGGNLTTRSLFIQAPGWPLVELVDGAARGGSLGANDRLYRLLVHERVAASSR